MATANVYRRKARQIAAAEHIDPDVFEAQIGAESNFDPNARSPAGALGIAQFMPGTARGLGVNPSNPTSALKGAARLDSRLLKKYGGDWKKTLAAYNAGEGAVDKYGGVPPYAETRGYVSRILSGKSTNQSTPPSSLDQGGVFSVNVGQKTTTDQAGFEQAQRRQMLANFLTRSGRGNSVLFRSGLLSTQAPSVADFTSTKLTSKLVESGGGDGTTSDAPSGGSVQDMLARAVAQSNTHQAYQWGGGHGATPAKVGTPVDCSGYVSQILGVSPRVSGQYASSFGEPGHGRHVTVYANSGHVLMSIVDPQSGKKRWFATSHSNPGGGAGEIAQPTPGYLSRFTARHPRGL